MEWSGFRWIGRDWSGQAGSQDGTIGIAPISVALSVVVVVGRAWRRWRPPVSWMRSSAVWPPYVVGDQVVELVGDVGHGGDRGEQGAPGQVAAQHRVREETEPWSSSVAIANSSSTGISDRPMKVSTSLTLNFEPRILARNRRARHDYEVLETFEAGLALTGTEVKSARAGRVQLKDSYVEVRDGEAWLIGAHIGAYEADNRWDYDPERDRKLLLHRREVDKIFGRTLGKGTTASPLAVYARGNWIKAEIALAQGKKIYDKREAARRRILDREAEEAIKGGRRAD